MGEPGTSLLAGKQNGACSYMMEVKKNLGTFHIIDGEKVTIKYRGQIKTCAKCHQSQLTCPGKGLAKDCSAERVLLSDHMRDHWNHINFKPNTTDMNEVDLISDEEIVTVSGSVDKKPEQAEAKVFKEPAADIIQKCTGIVIPGLKKDSDASELVECLKELGLPDDYDISDLHFKENRRSKTATIFDLSPDISVNLLKNIQGKIFAGRSLTAYTLVEETPKKETLQKLNSESSDSDDSINDDYDTSYEHNDPTNGFIFENFDTAKRKAEFSPSTEPFVQSRKERKKAKTLNK